MVKLYLIPAAYIPAGTVRRSSRRLSAAEIVRGISAAAVLCYLDMMQRRREIVPEIVPTELQTDSANRPESHRTRTERRNRARCNYTRKRTERRYEAIRGKYTLQALETGAAETVRTV